MSKVIKSRARTRRSRNKENKENGLPTTKHKSSNRPAKLRSWSDVSMLWAMEAVKDRSMGVNRAALEHGVPQTSLKDRLTGRVIHGTKIGPKPYLTNEEEKELVDFLVGCSKMGYGKTRSEVLKIVEATMKNSQIYNCDESGMPLEHKLPRVISIKGIKKDRQVSSGNKTQITILGCCSATGQAILPMVVFSGKNFNHDLCEGEVPGTLYESGWMDQELFSNWFLHQFLKHAVSSQPILLMLDVTLHIIL